MLDHKTTPTKRKLHLSREIVQRLDPAPGWRDQPALSNHQTHQGKTCNWPDDQPALSIPQTQQGPACAPAERSPEQPAREPAHPSPSLPPTPPR